MGYEGMIEAEWSRSYTGRFIPGDPINEMRNGPVKATLGPAQDARLLLVRNVRRGANLFERRERLQHTNARRLLVRGPGGGKTDPAPASAQGLR